MKLGSRITVSSLAAILISCESFLICYAIAQDVPFLLRDDIVGDTAKIMINKPHNVDWVQEHGMSVKETDASRCSNCHGAELNGGLAEVSCYQCHDNKWDSPHPFPWIDGHGRHVDRHGAAECKQCHAVANAQGVGSAVSCNACHSSDANVNTLNFSLKSL